MVEYAKKLTAVNAINLALLGWSPSPPKNLKIGGIVEPSVKFKWDDTENKDIIGYKIYCFDYEYNIFEVCILIIF